MSLKVVCFCSPVSYHAKHIQRISKKQAPIPRHVAQRAYRIPSRKRPSASLTMSQESPTTPQSPKADYTKWSNDELVQRVLALERKLRDQVNASGTPNPSINSIKPAKQPKAPKPFDPSKYTTRLIGLKFAYLGASYNGLEYSGNAAPLPTVEEEVWKALVRCRLISPPSLAKWGLDKSLAQLRMFGPSEAPVDWEGCEYSKCGRTDRGVSAFGQVIGIRVRSARKIKALPTVTVESTENQDRIEETEEDGPVEAEKQDFDPIKDELPYISLLNAVLPPTIRMVAWCPFPTSNFNARFSCKEREYRYFFTQPAFLPLSRKHLDQKYTARLDIAAMREAAAHLVGSHDFRNMCKIDPSKQITEFVRKITLATVERADTVGMEDLQEPADTEVYCVRFHGSAFLWHQVRCMVAVLFLVGQGLEKPSVVQELLDIKNCTAKPAYEMAGDRPLVLWDCRFSATAGKVLDRSSNHPSLWDRGEGADELEWIKAGEDHLVGRFASTMKWNKSGLMEDLWQNWRGAKMDEILTAQLMELVAGKNAQIPDDAFQDRDKSVRVFQGEDTAVSRGVYVPLMKRERSDTPEALNARWAERKGVAVRQSRRDTNGAD
ncbi:pseudouridine synthase [Microthyrium microscopicum]|uniref:Pseudouridine synthase n=1 Tax=Microthyrium microscopicum TaxID=703497 RepID=A0A6A6UM97_9PEZI|nr:pseudouridine synthase [Microthyrium microscopicum]